MQNALLLKYSQTTFLCKSFQQCSGIWRVIISPFANKPGLIKQTLYICDFFPFRDNPHCCNEASPGDSWGMKYFSAHWASLSWKHGAASTPGCFVLCRLGLVVGTLSSALVIHALCCSFPSVTHYSCATWHCVSVHLLSELHGFSFWEDFCPTLLMLIGPFALYSIKLWRKVQLSHSKDKFYSNRAQQGAVAHLNGLIAAARQWSAANSPGTQDKTRTREMGISSWIPKEPFLSFGGLLWCSQTINFWPINSRNTNSHSLHLIKKNRIANLEIQISHVLWWMEIETPNCLLLTTMCWAASRFYPDPLSTPAMTSLLFLTSLSTTNPESSSGLCFSLRSPAHSLTHIKWCN